MSRKLFFLGIAVAKFACHVSGAVLPSYEFAVVSNSVTAGVNLNAVANNGDTFVCVGAQNSPVLKVNTNGFVLFQNATANGGYLLFSNAWTKTAKNYWFDCIATQANGYIAAGASNAVYTSADGSNWTKTGTILPSGDQSYVAEGVTYNPVSGTYAAALSVYEASYTANPSSGWTAAGFQNQSFAESFRGITSFGGPNMALCGALGDIRISTNGGEYWTVSQQANLDLPALLSVASDGADYLVCAGDNSLIEVCTNGGLGATWAVQTKFNIGAAGSVTDFDAVAFSSAADSFLGVGTLGANGLIVMAPDFLNGDNWTWTRQTNLWTFKNGNLAPDSNNLPALNGASFANNGFFQGIALLVGNNGTVVVGGIPPFSPLPTYGNFVTNVLSEPEVNNILGTNNNANMVSDINHPASVLGMDWYTAPTNGVELATNSFFCQPPASYYNICGEFTNWVFQRDLRTGFASTRATPFVFTIIPPAPTNAVSGVTEVLGNPNDPLWVDVLVNAFNNNFVVNWYTDPTGSNSLNYLNDGSETRTGNRFFHTPTNTACGVYTIWAETMATNTPPSGASLVSSTRTPVTFSVVPAAPINPVGATNCANTSPSPLSASVPPGQVINWYNVPSGGFPLTSGPTYSPTDTLPGTYTYWAEAQDIVSGQVSTNRTPVIFEINPLPQPPAITVAPTSVLSGPLQTNSPLVVNTANSNVGNPVTVDWFMDSGAVTNAYTATNAADPNWTSGGGVIPATNTLAFFPTNRQCGTYTYYARARVIDPSPCGCLDCVSPVLTPVTFVLLPPAPTDSIVNLTNVLTGAIQTNAPIWVDLLTNLDYPVSSFVVNWYSTSTGSNSVNYLNNGTETNLSNRFFHTPNNVACGIFTNWAETMTLNTVSGQPMVSSDRTTVVFAIVPATPLALTNVGAFNQTNCTEVSNPTFTVTVTNGQTADWFAVPSSGTPAGTGTSFAPTNSTAGTWQFAAEAVDPISGLASTGSVLATLSLYDCTDSPVINLTAGTGKGTIQWPGNLKLLSATNLTPPIVWKSVSTGSVFTAPFNSYTFTNTNPPVKFFRLTN